MQVLDGLHRLDAARLSNRTHIPARLLGGEEADAFVLAVHSNVADGLRLSRPERRRAVERISHLHPRWSDRRIAAVAGLSARTVAEIRRRCGLVPQTRVGQDGRVRPTNRAAGRERAARILSNDPSLSLRRVAQAAGISPETVRSVKTRMREENKTPQPSPPRPRNTRAVATATHSAATPSERTRGQGAIVKTCG